MTSSNKVFCFLSDVRLARFGKEKSELQDQISHLKLELEEERSKRSKSSGSTLNGPNSSLDYDAGETQRMYLVREKERRSSNIQLYSYIIIAEFNLKSL